MQIVRAMHYVTGDMHNEYGKFRKLLERICFGVSDYLYLLGDLFDRGGDNADPVGVYFTVLGLGARCTVVRVNHDFWLSNYIDYYFSLSEKKRLRCDPYQYNSFALMKERLPAVDMQGDTLMKCMRLFGATKSGTSLWRIAAANMPTEDWLACVLRRANGGTLDIAKLQRYFSGREDDFSKDDYLIICGDVAACGFSSSDERDTREFLRKLPVTVLFADGNHENFDTLNAYGVEKWHGGNVHFIEPNIIHLMRGQVFKIGGKTFFTFGGAYSVERASRVEG